MPRFEIEIDDKGELAGKAPAELESLFKRTETTSYGNGLKKGREDAVAESAKQAEERIKAEREKWEKENPVGRVKELEEENLKFREGEATLVKRFNETARTREETHAKEVADKAEVVAKLTRRLGSLLKSQIRAEAVRFGARDESLGELEDLLIARVAHDADFEPFIKDEKGEPRTTQGKRVTLDAFVKEYLEQHPHHRKPASGAPGNARGGASFQGGGHGTLPSADAARARVEGGDLSPGAIDDVFQATRRRRQAS